MNHKTMLITGGGSGIGKAIAIKFAQNGYNVVIGDLNESNGQQVADEILSQHGNAISIKTNVAKPEDSEFLVAQTVAHFGKLDCAINNAGIPGAGLPTDAYPIETWDKEISVNLNGVFYGMKYQITQMIKQSQGAIVNLASVLGVRAVPNSPAYVASKHGVVGLTKTAALEYAKQNIRINAVGPGYTDTPLLGHYTEEKMQKVLNRHPMGRLAKSEEIANMVFWLCSEEASYVNGAFFPVDGGYTSV